MAKFLKGDSLDMLKTLADDSIDFLYFNPPFGTTRQVWDEKLPWKAIFAEMFRVVKPEGNIAIHCSVPFNYVLIREAPRAPNYSWYWNKGNTTTPLLAKVEPMRQMEEILVWKMSGKSKFNPQRVGTEVRKIKSNGKTDYVDKAHCVEQDEQTVIGKYQTHLITMSRTIRGYATRPDAMIELFIKTYTNEGDVVLDPTCYKGLSGGIALKLNRRWIGIDKYFEPEGFEYNLPQPAAAGGGK